MNHHMYRLEVKLLTIHLGFAISLYGCSSSYSIRSIAMRGIHAYGESEGGHIYRLDEELKGHHATIEMKDGKRIFAKEITISDDSVSWLDQRSDEQSRASIEQLDKIVIKNYLLGTAEGVGIGLAGGIVGGGGIGYLLGTTEGSKSEFLGLAIFMSTVYGAGIGLIAGGMTGGIIGHSYTYEFQQSVRRDSAKRMLIEKLSAKTAVLYLRNGRIVRGTILVEAREGNQLVRVTIRDVYGEIETYNGWEIDRIEKED